MLRKYDLRKYVNTFKARSQASVNKHNPTYGMCYCAVCLVPNAIDMAKILHGRRYDESLFIFFKVRWNNHLVSYFSLMYTLINTNILHLTFPHAEFSSFRIKC